MAHPEVYPYAFHEIYKEKIWGGRNLEMLGKKLPPEAAIGESWEVSVHAQDVSVVANGPAAGVSLGELLQRHRPGIMGEQLAAKYPERFPLLVKFIDAADILSVQVHPDDETAARYETYDTGKEETWIILRAAPGARLVRGVRSGTDRATFLRLVDEQRLDEVLASVTVHAGDVLHVPSGTLHAIGAGIVLAEIQRNSDATYRVYDWARVGADGQPRPLHIERAMAAIRWDVPPAKRSIADITKAAPLFDGEFYRIDFHRASDAELVFESLGRMRIVTIIRGRGVVRDGDTEVPFHGAANFLVPAAVEHFGIVPSAPVEALLTVPK